MKRNSHRKRKTNQMKFDWLLWDEMKWGEVIQVGIREEESWWRSVIEIFRKEKVSVMKSTTSVRNQRTGQITRTSVKSVNIHQE